MQQTFLKWAEATGRCCIVPHATAMEISVDDRDRATGVVFCEESGIAHYASGDLVCVSYSAVESARLLLLSRSKGFPDGLANRSGIVGQNLQFHTTTGVRGRFAGHHHGTKSPRIAVTLLAYLSWIIMWTSRFPVRSRKVACSGSTFTEQAS